MAPLVRTGGSRHTGLAALPHRNIQMSSGGITMEEKVIRTDYTDIQFQDNGKLKLLIIVGTRPEIIRLAAVINKCRKYFDVILAHTGQNYDYNLNGIFFENLKIKIQKCIWTL